MKTIKAKIMGMDCASCALNIKKALKGISGVDDAEINYVNEDAKITLSNPDLSIDDLNKTIRPLGYQITPSDEYKEMGHQTDHSKHSGINQGKEKKIIELKKQRQQVNFVLPLSLGIFCMMIWQTAGQAIKGFPAFPVAMEIISPILLVISSIVLFWLGRPFLKGIVNFLRFRLADMDTLIGIGTLSAFVYSAFVTLFPALASQFNLPDTIYFDVVIIVIGFVLFGKYLEARSKLKTGEAIERLISLQPRNALLLRNGKETLIPISEVVINDVLIIKPGDKIPVDGIIIEGTGAVDESMVTGESIPKDKSVGGNVIAGTINQNSVLKIKAVKVGADTLLANIIKMVENAQGSRAPIQNLADKISGIFVPAVMIIAVVSFALWLIIGSQFMPFNLALSNGLLCFVGVLVIACPCALGLATPTAIIVGVGKGAEKGILIKNAESLEKLHKVNMLVVDKTGTITKGEPEVTNIIPIGNNKLKPMFNILASLEKNSSHPLAKAVVKKSKSMQAVFMDVKDFLDLPGKGLTGTIHGVRYYAGNAKTAEEKGININRNIIGELTRHGKTPVLLFNEKELLMVVGIADAIKETSRKAIQDLHKLKIKVFMFTGDNRSAADNMAKASGVDQVISDVLPNEKAERIEELQRQGFTVAMAGDGINDAPGLARSDVGIAMGNGTDVAMEAADIILLDGDIMKISQAIKLSKHTMTTVKQNLFWAFIYNIIGIPLASGLLFPFFGIMLNPVFASLAMAFSSVSVVMNSLRLKLLRL